MNQPGQHVSVAILAGGYSRRMGRDKALLPLGSATLIERVIEAARPLADELFLIGDRPERFAHLALPVRPDQQPGQGPLAGLYTALTRAQFPTVLLLACDLPFVTTHFLRFLLDRRGDHHALVPRSPQALQHLCAVYTRNCQDAVAAALERGERAMPSFHDQIDIRVLAPDEWRRFDPHQRLLANLNTPQEYRQALELLA
ncbi:MAG: NTP transferase domain-containing protein [Candidatus Latescibacteria bacterium]|nr:NTP transferase domain-containing protein [Candidatus Latescibacterota bacterium]